ncbi:hypothetical protein HD553DRAFT_49701 [Filobasidium floriforme]|uniref:uncharacterized protein n=1 Tax=Filobasidium floriforme TaxID=5210 RepID=UPI001E8EDECB|nr:uncharacterized protein HD553DRAFT_49701 [Filobasidium floriforme]KAH8083642.1 hypothetical protein HD553DRAFT_49701 [Filobasidium floriforme]
MAPSTTTHSVAAASTPAQPPVLSKQMSNSNSSSRPTTPQTARNRSSRQRKEQPSLLHMHERDAADNSSGDPNTTSGPANSEFSNTASRQARNKPLPTASQLRQMESSDSPVDRPRGIINLPKQKLDGPARSRSRPARDSAVRQGDVIEGAGPLPTSKDHNRATENKRRTRPPKGLKGRSAADDHTTEDDVFSAGVHHPPTFGKLATPSKDVNPSRRPRHNRTVSEPFSVQSGVGGDDSFVQHEPRPLPSQRGSRKRRKDKDKDKGGGGRGGVGVNEVPLAPALGDLHIQHRTDAGSDSATQPPKRTGLRFPLTEEDDGESTASDDDDSGVAFDRTLPIEEPNPGRPFGDLNNAGARLLHELRSLSQSAPGGKSYLADHVRADDGYGSGSGYGSGQGDQINRPGRDDRRRQPNVAGRRGDLQDESAVWEMPGLQERGSGTDLTWQQSLLASPAVNTRTQTPRRAKAITPSAAPNTNKRNASARVTQGFTPTKSQIRDQETFGSMPAAVPAQFRSGPSGFATPMKHNQRLQHATDQRPHPHHTMSAPPNGFAVMEPVKRSIADDVKVYAGPTFHNSPSADSLPAPRMKGA